MIEYQDIEGCVYYLQAVVITKFECWLLSKSKKKGAE